ncbi:MAG: stage V sporulation protein AB [Clostridiales bacterium]|nr:stage V sporulation protein AB [Clostridiales bacterium]
MKTVILTIFIGLAGGLAVGASVTAFFTVLGVTAHIIKWSKSKDLILAYEICFVLGALLSCWVYFSDITIKYFEFLTIPLGFLFGIFIGMIAAALTETLDIISIAANKLKISNWIYLIVIVVLLGKVVGSLVFFLVPEF